MININFLLIESDLNFTTHPPSVNFTIVFPENIPKILLKTSETNSEYIWKRNSGKAISPGKVKRIKKSIKIFI